MDARAASVHRTDTEILVTTFRPLLPALIALLAVALVAFRAFAADYPAAQEGSWVATNFRFHTGEVMPELLIPASENTSEHGTTGNAKLYRRELGEVPQTAPRLAPSP